MAGAESLGAYLDYKNKSSSQNDITTSKKTQTETTDSDATPDDNVESQMTKIERLIKSLFQMKTKAECCESYGVGISEDITNCIHELNEIKSNASLLSAKEIQEKLGQIQNRTKNIRRQLQKIIRKVQEDTQEHIDRSIKKYKQITGDAKISD